MARGLIIAAPASGSGKTTVTLALLRHLRNRGTAVAAAKVGPDYIDPAFHAAAGGCTCRTLDSWAMRPETLAGQVAEAAESAELVICEGVMGLFDGASDGRGSTADLAASTGWPVVLVVDARGMAASAAALVRGFRDHRGDIALAGVVFNRIGGPGHAKLLRVACAPLGLPVIGCLPRDERLALPDRHLGLVQAGEHADLERFLEAAAALAGRHLDVDALVALARPTGLSDLRGLSSRGLAEPPIPPLGQRIAVARDLAFGFAYPFVLEGWRRAGAELVFFSPLADEAPDAAADAVYLPGGYPELHAAGLAANSRFLEGLRAAAVRGALVYGECGGYMVLGRRLIDGAGAAHAMAGLLPVETSFAAPRLSLGYRVADLAVTGPLGARGRSFRGHEFHFARLTGAAPDRPLFRCRDAAGEDRGAAGAVSGRVMGSFLHLVDRDGPAGEGRSAASARRTA